MKLFYSILMLPFLSVAVEFPSGSLRIDFLTARDIMISGDYRDFLRTELHQKTKKFRSMEKNPMIRPYQKEIAWRTAAAQVVTQWRPVIRKEWQKPGAFRLTDSSGKNIRWSYYGNRLDSAGTLLFPDAPVSIRQYAVLHRIFFHLQEPLSAGTVTLSAPFGDRQILYYQPDTFCSPVFKVSGIGYRTGGPKLLRAGFRLGSGGPLRLHSYAGKDFTVIRTSDKKCVYSGKIVCDASDSRNAKGRYRTGEETLIFDLTAYREKGKYLIAVKGLGYSPVFEITDDPAGNLYKLSLDRLNSYRCQGCHRQTLRDKFPWELADYAKKARQADRGFFNENGERISLTLSRLLSSREQTEKAMIPSVSSGGWHDPDGGKSPEQLGIVNDLLASYLWYPQNFRRQPDPAAAALSGFMIWRKAQQTDGGVGVRMCISPQDKKQLLVSAASRRGTLLYASHAAMAALVCQKQGRDTESNQWRASAEKAWQYALNPKNRLQNTCRTVLNNKVVSLHYYEAPDLPAGVLFKTAFDLFLLSGNREYLVKIQQNIPLIRVAIPVCLQEYGPFFFAEFQKEGHRFPELKALYSFYREMILTAAQKILSASEQPYRFHFSRTLRHDAGILTAAWHLTGETMYRNEAETLLHYYCGCNASGHSFAEPRLCLPLSDFSERIFGLYLKEDPKNHFSGSSQSFLAPSGKNISKKQNKILLLKSIPSELLDPFLQNDGFSDAKSPEEAGGWAAIAGCLIEPGTTGENHE